MADKLTDLRKEHSELIAVLKGLAEGEDRQKLLGKVMTLEARIQREERLTVGKIKRR